MSYSLAISLTEGTITECTLKSCLTIGRHSSCGICIPLNFISRCHCTLILMPPDVDNDRSYYLISDGHILGEKSANGTWLNGKAVSGLMKLNNEDVITFSSNSRYPKARFLDRYIGFDELLGTSEHEHSTAI